MLPVAPTKSTRFIPGGAMLRVLGVWHYDELDNELKSALLGEASESEDPIMHVKVYTFQQSAQLYVVFRACLMYLVEMGAVLNIDAQMGLLHASFQGQQRKGGSGLMFECLAKARKEYEEQEEK